MIRKIIEIDADKCNGCGLCAKACHEGAIGMVDGKAKLLRDDYCDGLGDCLPSCPTGAISFTEREAAAYDEQAVLVNQRTKLRQWPVQLKLAPLNAPYYADASLLIAADCAAYAYAAFHRDFMHNRVTLIGCPKLDNVDYSEKLAEILRQNTIRDIMVVRMVVPCCGGIEYAVGNAVRLSGKNIPQKTITLSTDGALL